MTKSQKNAAKMKEKLEETGIPHKQIECYGRQIVITAWAPDAASKWSSLLRRFANVRSIVETMDETKNSREIVEKMIAANPGLVLNNKRFHRVWRVFATVQ